MECNRSNSGSDRTTNFRSHFSIQTMLHTHTRRVVHRDDVAHLLNLLHEHTITERNICERVRESEREIRNIVFNNRIALFTWI